jgi:hypothetical protein
MCLRTETLKDARDFVRCWTEIEKLRAELNVNDDVLLDPLHFLSATGSTRRSCSVACWAGPALLGLTYATEHYLAGIRSGYAVGGDFVGRGLLLCAAENESAVLHASIQKLAAHGIHSLHLRLQPRADPKFEIDGMRVVYLEKWTAGDRMTLPATFDGFLATLGKHTRRNMRNSMRKAAAADIQFAPSLTIEEYQAAVARLNVAGVFHADSLHLARDERLLALHGGGRRMGLRAANGNLVSILCGFTRGSRFHLLTQLNDRRLEALSLSVVLRGHAAQELIASGHTELQFMGGTSLTLGRFCAPIRYRSIFVDKEPGAVAAAKRLVSVVARLTEHTGSPVPEKLSMVCNGELDRSMLIRRTALGIGSSQKGRSI